MARKTGTIPLQALPPDKRPKPLPDAFESRMPSGLVVKWRMPDPFALVAFADFIPDPLTAAVIDLLKDEKSYKDETDPFRHKHEAANTKGMYGLAAAMWDEPKLDATLQYGAGDTLGRREVGYQDVIATYQFFRFGTRNPAITPTAPNEPEQPTDVASDSDGVRTDASAAVAD